AENAAPRRTATRRPYSPGAGEGAREGAQRGRFAVRRGALAVLRKEVDPGVRESHEVLFIALEGVSDAVIIDALPIMGNFKAHSKVFSQYRDFSGQRFAGPSARPRYRPPYLQMRPHGTWMRLLLCY